MTRKNKKFRQTGSVQSTFHLILLHLLTYTRVGQDKELPVGSTGPIWCCRVHDVLLCVFLFLSGCCVLVLYSSFYRGLLNLPRLPLDKTADNFSW